MQVVEHLKVVTQEVDVGGHTDNSRGDPKGVRVEVLHLQGDREREVEQHYLVDLVFEGVSIRPNLVPVLPTVSGQQVDADNKDHRDTQDNKVPITISQKTA